MLGASGMRREVVQMAKELLKVSNLKMYYPVKVKGKGIFAEKKFIKAVDCIDFTVYEGETFGIVGESGCGKSTTGKLIVKLIRPTEGNIIFEGTDIFRINKEENAAFKKRIQIIFQDPYSSLDPRFTVERIIKEPLIIHRMINGNDGREMVLRLMDDVGISREFYNRYPHEFSGGQRQRIGVARALALNPSLVICDEPVSALDVSIQAQILNLMKELQNKYNLTYIFISHNLSVVRHICDRIAVMYLGHMVEIADKKSLFENSLHPYTKALLNAIPVPNPKIKSMAEMLGGDVPSPMNPPSGCCFHTRCQYKKPQCESINPVLKEIDSGHQVACHLYV